MSAFEVTDVEMSTTHADIASKLDQFPVLAKVVQAAQLSDTLASPGPFTVFAPTDDAFAKLPPGEVDRLLKPENRVKLTSFVASHILPGRLTVAELQRRLQDNGGHVVLRTVDNDTMTIEQHGEQLHVVGARGAHAAVTDLDLVQSNGVIHVTDSVLSAPSC